MQTTIFGNFFGNSFYLRGGPGIREIQATDKDILDSNNTMVTASSTSAVADIAIGNHWQWSNFTMGCGWVGAMIPFMAINSKYEDNRSYLTASEKASREGGWDDLER